VRRHGMENILIRWFIAVALLAVSAVAWAQAPNDLTQRVNNEIALKLGALEINNASLMVQLDMAKVRLAEMEKLCGDACKPKEPGR